MAPNASAPLLLLLLLAASAALAQRLVLDTKVFRYDRATAGAGGRGPGVYAGEFDDETKAELQTALANGAKLLLLFRHGKAQHNDVPEQANMWRQARAFGAGNLIDERVLPSHQRLSLVDPPLTQRGFEDAEVLRDALRPWFDWLGNVRPSLVSYVSSPLLRAVQTATTVGPDVTWALDEAVREAVSTLGSDLRNPLHVLRQHIEQYGWKVSDNMYTDEEDFPISDDVAEMPMFVKPTVFSDKDLYMGKLRFENIGERTQKWLNRVLYHNSESIHVVSSHGIFLSTVLEQVGFGRYRLGNCEMVPLLLVPADQ